MRWWRRSTFPDEVESPSRDGLRATLVSCCEALATLGETWERGRLVRDGVAVTIAGAANAGKSSLFNALLGIDRALVSHVRGTTRDTIEERVALPGGIVARLTDSAGIRRLDGSGAETSATSVGPGAFDGPNALEAGVNALQAGVNALEVAGIARSRAALAGATIALVVVDASIPLSNDAADVLRTTRDRPRLVFYNKSDLGRVAYDARGDAEAGAMLGSALDPATPERVGAALAALASGSDAPDLARPLLATARQADAAARAEQSLRLALAALDGGEPEDLLATDLTRAAAALDELIGRDVTEAMLERIFARFCIGK